MPDGSSTMVPVLTSLLGILTFVASAKAVIG